MTHCLLPDMEKMLVFVYGESGLTSQQPDSLSSPSLSVDTPASDGVYRASTLISVCSPWSQFKYFACALTAIIEAMPSPLTITACYVIATMDPLKNTNTNVPIERIEGPIPMIA